MECGISHNRIPNLVTTFANPPGRRHRVQKDAASSLSPTSSRAHTPPASTAARSVHRPGRLHASILPFTCGKNAVFPLPRLFASHKPTNARCLQVGRSEGVDEAGLGEEVRLHAPGFQAPLNQGDEAPTIVSHLSLPHPPDKFLAASTTHNHFPQNICCNHPALSVKTLFLLPLLFPHPCSENSFVQSVHCN